MTKTAKKLKTMLENEVIPEIKDYIDELFEIVASKKETDEDKEELKEMQTMLEEFNSIVEDVQSGEMDDEECEDLINDIKTMREIED